MTDPEFVRTVALPDLSPPEILGHSRDGNAARHQRALRVRGTARPDRRSACSGPELALVQTVRLDPDTALGHA